MKKPYNPSRRDSDFEVNLGQHRSPARKQRRRQSLPPRLCALGASKPASDSSSAGVLGSKQPAPQWAVPGHLSPRQKTLYARVTEVCHRVSTQPLPVRVSAVTGHGEFFDVGDPIPKHATLVVDGTEDPLVKGLRLERLCSAALSERARRRNEQMVHAVQSALGKEGVADSCIVSTEWWTQLCANKHLTEDSTLKRVRDGEPLGSVADGVEWALLEMIRARNRHVPSAPENSASTRYNEDVAILVKVARKWASCLTWSRVTHGSWSYQGITTRLLKQGVPQVDVVVNVGQATQRRGKESSRQSAAASVVGDDKWKDLQQQEKANGSVLHSDLGVPVWRPYARDVDANLARVFSEKGREEAVLLAAIATAQRAEMLARCHALLRAALHDLVEGKASTDMLQGVDSAAVTKAFLLWLQESAARNILSSWARSKEAVIQVIGCIASAIEREARVSDAVTCWSKTIKATEIAGFTPPAFHTSSVREANFNTLKRAELLRRQEADSVAVLVHHTLYLVLPCQPIKFHFVWGRFMRFYYGMSLYQHVARYYTEVIRTEGWLGTGGWGLVSSARVDGQGNEAASVGSSAEARPIAEGDIPSLTEGADLAQSHSRRQVAGNLVKPRELEFRPSYREGAWISTGSTADSVRRASGGVRKSGSPERTRAQRVEGPSPLSRIEAAVANECLVTLLASHGTATRFATGTQVAAALKKEGFPDSDEALSLLKDAHALRGRGVRNHLWRGRRWAALVRVRSHESLFARLPQELFRNVLHFLAS